jgi:RND family efflux transporter MFP subunit
MTLLKPGGRLRHAWGIFLTLPLFGIDCGGKPPATKKEAPEVIVSSPVMRQVSDFEDFVGQLKAVKTIDVRARVSGYLDRVDFEDGTEVVEGTVLCEIDPRSYEAEVARTTAALKQATAHRERLERDFRRAQILASKEQLAKADLDLTTGDYTEAGGAEGVAKAQASLAALNLSYTKVTAFISGRLSRRMVDPGNLVVADSTMITSIVSQDPIYVYFDMDERTVLKIKRLVNEGKVQSRTDVEIPILGALADESETGYPHRGTINFSDNQLDTNTGTLNVRASLPNPKPRVFTPGMFMKVHLPVGRAYETMLIPEKAVGTDQESKYVFILDNDNKVIQRAIKVGNLYKGFRSVHSGLQLTDKVIVTGLQRARPGVLVRPTIKQEDPPDNVSESPLLGPAAKTATAAALPAAPPATKPAAAPSEKKSAALPGEATRLIPPRPETPVARVDENKPASK